ncbi:GNAT family N-acetyltransferase [Nafulsella turpanensis]|uniref:GNAT family N-acetyltransferase n=1 Tax=Nafulsella turpanensis TaxID=1265690 RepID=UPI000344CD78|nr:GNAT family N-acetyltransferase [Nafulsella turpanensis]
MTDFPALNTERLILRSLSFVDIPKIIEYANNARIAEMTLNIPHPYTEKDAVYWINMAYTGFEKRIQYTFGIYLNTTSEFIGGIGLKVDSKFDRGELGYWIAEQFWNNGYASEAVKEIIIYGFENLNLNKIFATHFRKSRIRKSNVEKQNDKRRGTY